MKNKWVRAVLGISVIALCLGGGYWLGRQSDPGRQEEAPPAESRENEKEYDTDLIAIVNMDEGVQKGSETVIYSQSLLGTLDVSYEVTGMEAAKQGLENGTYSAYLILPGGFSAAVESINTSPQKAVLEYAISQELTKEALADAVDHVQDIYASLNNGIGELYLSSVLSEVHKVQDAVGTISENDTADLNALEGIRGDDLRETVQMPELQEVEMDIDVLDLAPDYEQSALILEQFDGVYQAAWSAGMESFEQVQTSSSVLEQQISGENGTQQAVNNLFANHGQEMQIPDYEDHTEAENTKFNEIKDSALDEIDKLGDKSDQLEIFKEDQNAFNQQAEYVGGVYQDLMDQLGTPDFAEDINDPEAGAVHHAQYKMYRASEVDQKLAELENEKSAYASGQLQEYYDSIIISEGTLDQELRKMYKTLSASDPDAYPEKTEEEWAEYVRSLIAAPVLPGSSGGNPGDGLTPVTLDTYYPKEKAVMPDLSQITLEDVDSGSITQAMSDLVTTSNEYTAERNGYLLDAQSQLKAKDAKVREDLDTFGESYNLMLQAKDELGSLIGQYDPQIYLDTEEVSGLKQSLGENQSGIQDKIQTQNRQYEEYVTEVYKASAENTQKQRESIETAAAASEEKLDTNLANAKSLKQSTWENNQALLNSIQGVLPYTRLGTQENLMTYRFMVNPLTAKDLTVFAPEISAKGIGAGSPASDTAAEPAGDGGKQMPALLISIPLLLLILICAGVIGYRKRSASSEEHL